MSVFAAFVRGADHGRPFLFAAREAGLPRDDAVELALMSFLFAGFPRCINALTAVRSVYGEPAVADGGPAPVVEPAECRRRGGELFSRIYADHADRVLQDLGVLQSDLPDLIIEIAYGRILARKELDARVRELAAVAALIVSGDRRQLLSHMLGSLRCGADLDQLESAVEIGLEIAAGSADVAAVRETLRRVRSGTC